MKATIKIVVFYFKNYINRIDYSTKVYYITNLYNTPSLAVEYLKVKSKKNKRSKKRLRLYKSASTKSDY